MSSDLTDLATVAEWRPLLTEVEQRVVDYALRGRKADLCGDNRVPEDDRVDAWDGAPEVRAAVLEVLAVGERDDWPLHHRGINLVGARIVGQLELNFATISAPLTIVDCDFAEPIRMWGATVKTLKLDGTRVPGLFADGATFDSYVLLRNGFTATGEVNLLNVKIGAGLECDNAELTNNDGPALNLEGARVEGNVSLRDCTAIGEVRLTDATIAGTLACNGATLTNPEDVALANPESAALVANRARVAGTAYLSEKFTANGGVRLVDATIEGSLSCIDATFTNAGGDAITALRVNVGGSVFLRDGFCAAGAVLFADARIGGILSCTGKSTFSNPGGYALVAARIRVGTVLLRDGFTAIGRVHFVGARIAGELDCTGATFTDTGDALPAGVVDLQGASAAVLIDDVAAWPDGWRGDGFSYDDFGRGASIEVGDRLGWLDRQAGGFRSATYSHLAAVYRRRGDPDAARRVLIAREGRRGAAWSGWRRLAWRVWGALSAYGYRPSYALVLLAAVAAVASAVFALTPMIAVGAGARVTFVPVLYAADLAVPVINLRQADAYLPEQLWAQWWMWATIVVGWVASLAFVAAVTGLFRPDE